MDEQQEMPLLAWVRTDNGDCQLFTARTYTTAPGAGGWTGCGATSL